MSKVQSCSSKQRSKITHYSEKVVSAEVKERHPAGRWGQETIEAQSTWSKAPVKPRDGTTKSEAAANLEAKDQRTDIVEQVVNELNPGQ